MRNEEVCLLGRASTEALPPCPPSRPCGFVPLLCSPALTVKRRLIACPGTQLLLPRLLVKEGTGSEAVLETVRGCRGRGDRCSSLPLTESPSVLSPRSGSSFLWRCRIEARSLLGRAVVPTREPALVPEQSLPRSRPALLQRDGPLSLHVVCLHRGLAGSAPGDDSRSREAVFLFFAVERQFS